MDLRKPNQNIIMVQDFPFCPSDCSLFQLPNDSKPLNCYQFRDPINTEVHFHIEPEGKEKRRQRKI